MRRKLWKGKLGPLGEAKCMWCGITCFKVSYIPKQDIIKVHGPFCYVKENSKYAPWNPLPVASLEHIVPKSKGGKDRNNIGVACVKCNSTRR